MNEGRKEGKKEGIFLTAANESRNLFEIRDDEGNLTYLYIQIKLFHNMQI